MLFGVIFLHLFQCVTFFAVVDFSIELRAGISELSMWVVCSAGGKCFRVLLACTTHTHNFFLRQILGCVSKEKRRKTLTTYFIINIFQMNVTFAILPLLDTTYKR